MTWLSVFRGMLQPITNSSKELMFKQVTLLSSVLTSRLAGWLSFPMNTLKNTLKLL